MERCAIRLLRPCGGNRPEAGKHEDFYSVANGVRKSTTTTATDHGEAARGCKARLCGVLHIATIGHDSTGDFRPLNVHPRRDKNQAEFYTWPGSPRRYVWSIVLRPDTGQHLTTEGPR